MSVSLCLRGALLAFLALPAGTANPLQKPELGFQSLLRWAGPEAPDRGFTEDKVKAFLAARSQDLKAAKAPEWMAWLKGFEAGKGLNLRVWALCRRLEAGDLTAYGEFQRALGNHLYGISKPMSGHADDVIEEPPVVSRFPLPSALRMDSESGFWLSLAKTLHESSAMALTPELYSVWCFSTHPSQRALILELASKVETPLTLRNQSADPWNDPRFWIVLDWAYAWGTEADFLAIGQAIPDGPQRATWMKLFNAARALPAFFSHPVEPFFNTRKVDAPVPDEPGKSVDVDFSTIKVAHQPMAPPYPSEAKARQMMTNLVLSISVNEQGLPVFCRPLPGPWLAFFAPAGIEFAMKWRFKSSVEGLPLKKSRFKLTMPFRMRSFRERENGSVLRGDEPAF